LCPGPYSQWVCNCSLYFGSFHISLYYPVSNKIRFTPSTVSPSLLLVCPIPMLFPYTLSECYDPHTIATTVAADSHTVVGYQTDTLRTVLVMLSINLYQHSSDYFGLGQAIPKH